MSVYFAAAFTEGLVKIGFSSAPFRRVSSLRTQHKIPLKMVALLDGDRSDERKFHARFDAVRSHGEWFFYKGELKRFLDAQPLPGQTSSGYQRCLRPQVSEAYLIAKAERNPKFSVAEAIDLMSGWRPATAYKVLGKRDVPAGRRPK